MIHFFKIKKYMQFYMIIIVKLNNKFFINFFKDNSLSNFEK